MPAKQRKREKRRTFAKLRIQRKKESSELIDTIDGNPIFTEEDIEDNRITKLLQQNRSSTLSKDEKDIFLTDLLDIDSDDDNDNDIDMNTINISKDTNADNIEHRQMLEDIFASQSVKQPTIMGSQLSDNPFQIQTNATDLQYLMRRKNKKNVRTNLSQELDELNDEIIQNERVTMNEMISTLNLPMSKSAKKQITQFDDNQELQRLKLGAQSKVNIMNVVRKEKALQMDQTRKDMQTWSQAVTNKFERLKHKHNMVPPRNNMESFMENMEWNGDLGKELQCILDDYTCDNDLDTALQRHKPSKFEVVKQAKKMSQMRRQIANQIKEFKRVKKIKSRAFRKRIRARKAKVEPSLSELKEIDPRLYNREVRKLVRRRAEERMTLRHKNSSKWAVNIIRRGKDGKMDLNSRKALMEQLERGKALKRKIEGLDSDDSSESQNESVSNTENISFETEVESEKAKKEKYISEAKAKGIWNMKFMKNAEDKRRADIRALTKTAEKAKGFGELDDLERNVSAIEESAYSINPLINAKDDPIGSDKYAKQLFEQKKERRAQINMAQTILGKRKYGFGEDDSESMERPSAKKVKRRVLAIGDSAKMIDGTQRIEESVFGKGSKSIVRVDIPNSDSDVIMSNGVMKEREMSESVFEMVSFPKHDSKGKSVSEINKEMSKRVDRNDKTDLFGFDKKATVKTQRFYKASESEENESVSESNDGWSVILKGNESVHSVQFGTLPLQNMIKSVSETTENVCESKSEDLNAFLCESESDSDSDSDSEKAEIKSILKRSKYDSVGKDDKHIKFGKNEYSDGNPTTKYHSNNNRKKIIKKVSQPKMSEKIESNPWLNQLQNKNKKSNKKVSKHKNTQKQTTQFDANKMLIPKKLRKTPDFNLLQNNDPKQINMIYDALKDKKSDNKNMAQFIPNNTAEQDFAKLKDSVISDAMPKDIEGPLLGWDNWTGHGITKDLAYLDSEYLQSKALYEKRKKQLLANRSDSGLANVILSDKISKASSKYVMKWQPEWVNMAMYNAKMNDTMGREWNLSNEFFNAIKTDCDIPNGYIVKPTRKEDAKDYSLSYKTQFGNRKKKKGGKEQKLHSIYKGNIHKKRHKFVDNRPERGKA